MAAAWTAPGKLRTEGSNGAGQRRVQMRHSSLSDCNHKHNRRPDRQRGPAEDVYLSLPQSSPERSWKLKLSRWVSDALAKARPCFRTSVGNGEASGSTAEYCTLHPPPPPSRQLNSLITCFQRHSIVLNCTLVTASHVPSVIELDNQWDSWKSRRIGGTQPTIATIIIGHHA